MYSIARTNLLLWDLTYLIVRSMTVATRKNMPETDKVEKIPIHMYKRRCIKKFPDYFTQTANRWHHVNVCAMIESWQRRYLVCKVASLCEHW
jgi:hypothetical protein